MDQILIKCKIDRIGEDKSTNCIQQRKTEPQFQIQLTFAFKNEKRENLKIRKIQSLEKCLKQFQQLVSVRQKQIIPTKKIELCIDYKIKDCSKVGYDHIFCQIQNKIIQILFQTCPFITSILIFIQEQCICCTRILKSLPSCPRNILLNCNLNWKFLSKIMLRNEIKPKLFQNITLNPYKYLTDLTIACNFKSNKIFSDLSRAQWPSLVRLYLFLIMHTADGLRVLKKHCFHKLQYICSYLDDIGCMKSRLIAQTGVRQARLRILFQSTLTQSAKNTENLILRKYVVKTKLKEIPGVYYYGNVKRRRN